MNTIIKTDSYKDKLLSINKIDTGGVEYKRLGEVCTFNRGTVITAQQATKGDIPVMSGGQKPAYYHNTANRTGETIIVASSGAYAGYVSYWTTPVFVSDAFTVDPDESVHKKYLYHFLKNNQLRIYGTKRGAGVPHVHGSSISNFLIPLPPLEVQRAIADVLDKFSALEAELEAELDCRKRQYEYYREKLLNFEQLPPPEREKIKFVRLGEVGTFTRGNGLQKKDFTETGVPCIHYGQIYTHYGTFATETISKCSTELAKNLRKAKKGDLIITTTSENVEDVGKAVAWLGEEDVVIGGHECSFSHNENPKYISYLLQTQRFSDFKRRKSIGVKVIDLSYDKLADYIIPLPHLEVQRTIADVLDRFERLTSDLSEGLPAEIAARRRQYEHYRERLLSFGAAE